MVQDVDLSILPRYAKTKHKAMDTEIEAKFTDVDPDEIRRRLKAVGARLVHPEFLMRRKVYEHPVQKESDWFRIRKEYGKVTMSYKKLNNRTLHGTQEITFTVPDFDQACRFLEGAQLRFVAYQEPKRETWQLDNSEVTIDTWPWIPTFVEIESPTEEEVTRAATKLGFNRQDALHGSVENVYIAHYDVTEDEVGDWPEITFIPVPDWLEKKRRVRK